MLFVFLQDIRAVRVKSFGFAISIRQAFSVKRRLCKNLKRKKNVFRLKCYTTLAISENGSNFA